MSKWLIERAGIKITVNAKTDAAQDLVLSALGALRPKKVSAGQGIRLVVNQQDDHWLLNDRTSNLKRKIKQPGDLIYHLTDRIVFHIADKSEKSHALHAGAAANDEFALVIPASSGSGKSHMVSDLL